MSRMGRYLKMTVRRNLSCFAHFVQCPQASFIINKEATASETSGTFHILYGANNLLLTTQTIPHTNTLLRMYRRRRVRGCTGADGKNQISLPFVGKLHHLTNLLICQTYNTLRHTVQVQTVPIHCLQKSLHYFRALNSGNFKAVLATIRKSFFRSRQIVCIPSGETD